MKKRASLILLSVSFLGLSLCISSLKVYVKPAGPSSSSSECPSGSLPCHSLQYYVNHSNFTNNSVFLFLPGEHHLDSVVDISNVANLSLEGVSSGVKILCNLFPSGFYIRKFTGVSIKKMAISNCIQPGYISLNLEFGSGLSVGDIVISSNLKREAIGLMVTGVTGLLSISNSFFSAPQGGSLIVNFTDCNQHSHFSFSNNQARAATNVAAEIGHLGLLVDTHCSDVHILLIDSFFLGSDSSGGRLLFHMYVLTNISLVVSNSIFENCYIVSKAEKIPCNNAVMAFMEIALINSALQFEVSASKLESNNCTIAIENSIAHSDSLVSITSAFNNLRIQAKLSNVTFINNYHFNGGVCLFWYATVQIVNCSFSNNTGLGSIEAETSELVFEGHNTFKNNKALIGAGIKLISSYIVLKPHTYILFENNLVQYLGGAIYADSDGCFFHAVADSETLEETIEVNFINNSAGLGGSSLYAKNLDQCNGVTKFFNVSNTELLPSAVASDPDRVCFCEEDRNQPNCHMNNQKEVEVFPGETFLLHLAIVGRSIFHGVVTGVIRTNLVSTHSFSSDNAMFGPLQNSQIAHHPRCEDFAYVIYSTSMAEVFYLSTERVFLQYLDGMYPYIGILRIDVIVLRCPLGFFLSNNTRECECDSILKNNGIICDINDQSIFRPANTWIGFVNASDTPEDVIILFHPHCPIGYCLPYDTNITSNTSDSQCAPHRTGLLCGKCEDGYSLTLGNGTCATCSNIYLLLILPLAVSGLLLVTILFALNLTVTEGTINGLIFYANILDMNHSTLHSGEVSWLYTFLAWLNLDLGISTCFYDGMDNHAETWLQFIFPIYLWIIVLVIIKLYSRFPRHANRFGGGNAVKVLATLLVLSYTKLQQTVVTIMSFTKLEYPDGVTRYVWLYDANVNYFMGKHVYLVLAGIFALVFLILPYTLSLVFFQQLQACSNRVPFQWINKFKPLLDSYAGPYKDRYHFWTGMLLLVRTILMILFTANTSGSVEFNLLMILTVSLALTLANSNGMYKKWPLNYLETFFYLQLGVFSGGIMYAKLVSGNISIVANTSIALSLTAFLIVIAYHSLLTRKGLKNYYYYHFTGYAAIKEDDVSLNHDRFIT